MKTKRRKRNLNLENEYKRIFPKVDIERVLDFYDISYRTIGGKNGPEYLMRCPFPDHDDNNPSFCLNKKTGVYNCFVCGGGNFFLFIKNIEGFKTFEETLKFIKNNLGIVDKPEDSFNFISSPFKELTELDEKNIPELKEIELPKSFPAEKFLRIVKKRVTINTIRKFKLRYCESDEKYRGKYDGRLIIPIYFQNKIVSFAARDMIGKFEQWKEKEKELLDDYKSNRISKRKLDSLILKYQVRKYLYPYGSPIPYIFFNWDEAIKNKEYVILVEGIFDCIKLVNWGYNCIAILSCHLNQYRINLLLENFKTVYLCLDNDDKINKLGKKINPGQESATLVLEKLSDINRFNILLPQGKDPDECLKEEFDLAFKESKNFFKIW